MLSNYLFLSFSFQAKEHTRRQNMPKADAALPSKEDLLSRAPARAVDLPGELERVA